MFSDVQTNVSPCRDSLKELFILFDTFSTCTYTQ